MILSDLKQLIQSHQIIALKEICEHLNSEPEAVRAMLDYLIEKNLIEKMPEGTRCQSCTICPPETIELFRWK